MTTTTASTTTTKGAWQGDDFPSWLSPMVVKELRQGGQSGAFAWTFVGLQGAMFLLMSWALASFNSGADWQAWQKQAVSVVFWLVVGMAVVVIVPLRGLAAISSERVGNNLDLVRLTRLSATWIVIGKWLAIVAQGALLVTAVLPYIVLRYFFGGVNVVRDLEVMGWLFVGSMLVTAAALALSTQPLWIRIGAAAMGALVLPTVGVLDRGFVRFGTTEKMAILAVFALYTAVLLEYAAARIAPIAENHALRKRSIALILALAWLAAGAFATEKAAGMTFAVTLPLLVVYAIEALLEKPVHLRSQVLPFATWGLPGRLAARLLIPGWATGLNFVVVLAAICLAGLLAVILRFETDDALQFAVAFGSLAVATVLFPLPFVVYFPRVRYRLLLYALVQLVCFLIFVYTRAMKPHDVPWVDWHAGSMSMLPFPLAALCWTLSADSAVVNRSGMVPLFTGAAAVVTGLVVLSVAGPWYRQMRETSRLLAACRGRRRTEAARAGTTA
jgi:hypothetical protein